MSFKPAAKPLTSSRIPIDKAESFFTPFGFVNNQRIPLVAQIIFTVSRVRVEA
jgi:hypothetical protein